MSALEGISEQGADVASATGVSYTDLGNTEVPTYEGYDSETAQSTIDTDAAIDSGISYIDQDKSTVAGQLKSLLDEESPYITQARLAGEKLSAQRGMLNTSLAAGASEAQAIQAALPIAQQDAQTYATAQGMEQQSDYQKAQTQTEAIVSGELSKQNAAIAATDQRIQNMFTAQMQSATEQNQVFLQDMQNTHQTFLADMEAAHQLTLQREDLSGTKAQYAVEASSSVMQNYQISVENMMTDPDFLNLGTDAVNNAVNELQTLAKNSIQFIGAASGVDLDDFVTEYLGNITVMDEDI